MNTIRKTLLLTLCASLLSSCSLISINMTSQGLLSYYRETLFTHPTLFFDESEVPGSYCEILNKPDPNVLLSNGVKLKECLQGHEEAIVYIWSPKCSASKCLPLNLMQQAADEKGIELFIVAEYFDGKLMSKAYQIERPILGIDVSYYKANFTHRYISKFLFDITGGELKKSDHRLFYFEKGKYQKSVLSLEDV